jgi:MoxR-like ATPase
LARHVAHRLGWRYYEAVITSRTQARDLLYSFDSLRRLNDAQIQENRQIVAEPANYIEPGPIWWTFNRASARRRGTDHALPSGRQPAEPYADQQPDTDHAVLLIDEIDKADPDLPNALLVPLGALHFLVEETETPVHALPEKPPLVVITTNEERELPPAFVRRCVVLRLEAPTRDRLIAIAELHFDGKHRSVYAPIAQRVLELSPPEETSDAPAPGPSTAEYLDAVWACAQMGVGPGSKDPEKQKIWQSIEQATLIKGRAMGKS